MVAKKGEAISHFRENLYTHTDECKIWPFRKVPKGYGLVAINRVGHYVHVLACEAWHGSRPEGMWAIHGPCHNPSCWNGQHLSWGTPQQNFDDRHRDGTSYVGQRNPSARLSEKDVIEILARYKAGVTRAQLAEYFKISRSHVGSILTGAKWPHIPRT